MLPIISIRASSLSELFDCPARWESKYINGMRSKSSGASVLGTALHAGTAVFDSGFTPDSAVGCLVDSLNHIEDDTADWEDFNKQSAEKIGASLLVKYCTRQVDYRFEHIELDCGAIEIPDLGLALTGSTDRVFVQDGKRGIADIKSGKTAVGSDGLANTKGHAFQLGVYELLAENSLELPIAAPAKIIGMQTADKTESQRIAVGEVSGSRELLLGTEDRPGVLEYASKIIHSGVFFGNPRSMLCSKRYCPNFERCKFKC